MPAPDPTSSRAALINQAERVFGVDRWLAEGVLGSAPDNVTEEQARTLIQTYLGTALTGSVPPVVPVFQNATVTVDAADFREWTLLPGIEGVAISDFAQLILALYSPSVFTGAVQWGFALPGIFDEPGDEMDLPAGKVVKVFLDAADEGAGDPYPQGYEYVIMLRCREGIDAHSLITISPNNDNVLDELPPDTPYGYYLTSNDTSNSTTTIDFTLGMTEQDVIAAIQAALDAASMTDTFTIVDFNHTGGDWTHRMVSETLYVAGASHPEELAVNYTTESAVEQVDGPLTFQAVTWADSRVPGWSGWSQ